MRRHFPVRNHPQAEKGNEAVDEDSEKTYVEPLLATHLDAPGKCRRHDANERYPAVTNFQIGKKAEHEQTKQWAIGVACDFKNQVDDSVATQSIECQNDDDERKRYRQKLYCDIDSLAKYHVVL